MVFSGPLVRSSYMADLVNEQAVVSIKPINWILALATAALLVFVFPASISSGSPHRAQPAIDRVHA